jgi:hypothetical protein
VNLDAARPEEAHDPDKTRARLKKVGDLGLELFFVLADARVLNRERRNALDPAGLVGDVANSDVRSPQLAGTCGEARLDAGLGDGGIRVEDLGTARRASRTVAARGSAIDGVAPAELIAIAGGEIAIRNGPGPS